MSSTNRGAERQPDDFYVTPERAVLPVLPHLLRSHVGGPAVLDPAVGTGALLRATATRWMVGIGMDVVDRGWPDTIIRDALSPEPWPVADLIICNPPYSLATQFLERALREAVPGAEIAFLLRLSWMAGQDRARFHRAHPSDVYVLPKRPSFTAHLKWHMHRCPMTIPPKKPGGKACRCDREAEHDGACMTIGTDSCEYGWWIWGNGRGNRWFVLDCEGAKHAG